MYWLLTHLLEPYLLLQLLVGLALIWLARKRPEQRRLRWVAIPYLVLLVLSMPVTAHFFIGFLEWQNPPLGELPEDVQAIVVLGSGVLEPSTFRPEAELDPAGTYRTCHAARLYQRLARAGRPCLVLASGGKVDASRPGPFCAEPMVDLLVEMGVPREQILAEVESRSTYENALYSARLLQQRGLNRVLVVTDGWHLPRAMACFHKQGLQPIAAGCQYNAVAWEPDWEMVVPSPARLVDVSLAIHEWLGLAWYKVSGRI